MGQLKIHILSVHEREKPHNCTICDTSFAQNVIEKSLHIATVHEKQKPHQCSIFYASFTENCLLKRHIASVHKGQKVVLVLHKIVN